MIRVSVRTVSAALLLSALAFSPAMALDSPDPLDYISDDSPGYDEYVDLIDRLTADGSEILVIQTTFLGRIRMIAVRDGMVREIVISPNTGEIRRDIIVGDYDAASFTQTYGESSPGNSEFGRSRGKKAGHDKDNGKGKAKGKNK